MTSFADRIRWFLVTSGGLGHAPVASGTFGTLGGIAVAALLQVWLTGTELVWGLVAATVVLLGVGCTMTAYAARAFPRKDPGEFVLDEVVGYLAALAIYAAVQGDPGIAAHAACFFFFRLFDVLKTFPANKLEAIPGAPGVMLDDVVAGLYAGGVLVLFAQVVEL